MKCPTLNQLCQEDNILWVALYHSNSIPGAKRRVKNTQISGLLHGEGWWNGWQEVNQPCPVKSPSEAVNSKGNAVENTN